MDIGGIQRFFCSSSQSGGLSNLVKKALDTVKGMFGRFMCSIVEPGARLLSRVPAHLRKAVSPLGSKAAASVQPDSLATHLKESAPVVAQSAKIESPSKDVVPAADQDNLLQISCQNDMTFVIRAEKMKLPLEGEKPKGYLSATKSFLWKAAGKIGTGLANAGINIGENLGYATGYGAGSVSGAAVGAVVSLPVAGLAALVSGGDTAKRAVRGGASIGSGFGGAICGAIGGKAGKLAVKGSYYAAKTGAQLTSSTIKGAGKLAAGAYNVVSYVPEGLTTNDIISMY
ncbi:hypothetical protein [Endozoicomonas sp. OPT23]|uniref:hypothetical protein n=1 Tax=Endozoicomonas sp. OPT23 TaxID=2072845 RepID=UPI00129B6A73|nr:hypothetical protein [Endozoicomonas sp. OPT23]